MWSEGGGGPGGGLVSLKHTTARKLLLNKVIYTVRLGYSGQALRLGGRIMLFMFYEELGSILI